MLESEHKFEPMSHEVDGKSRLTLHLAKRFFFGLEFQLDLYSL